MSLPYLQNALKTLKGVPYFINGTSQLKQIIAIFFLQVSAIFTGEDEPQESVSRATLSSTVQPYLVNSTAVFVN